MTAFAVRVFIALLPILLISLAGCARKESDLNMWGWPRLVTSQEAQELLKSVIASARSGDEKSCRPETEFDRSGRLVSQLLAASTQDIVDYGQLPGEDDSAVELIIRTPAWPQKGLSVLVRIRGRKCDTYSLSTAREPERRSTGGNH